MAELDAGAGDTSDDTETEQTTNTTDSSSTTTSRSSGGSGGHVRVPSTDDSGTSTSSGSTSTDVGDQTQATGTPDAGGHARAPSSDTSTDTTGGDTTRDSGTEQNVADRGQTPGTPGAGGYERIPQSESSPPPGANETSGPQTDVGRGSQPDPEYQRNFVDQDRSGTASTAEIGMANRVEDVLQDEYGARNYEYTTAGGDIVVRFEQNGRTEAIPVDVDGDGVSQAARETAAAERYGVSTSDITIENGTVRPETETGARALGAASIASTGESPDDVRTEEVAPGIFEVEGENTRGVAQAPGENTSTVTLASPEGSELVEELNRYEGVRQQMQESAREAEQIEAGQEARRRRDAENERTARQVGQRGDQTVEEAELETGRDLDGDGQISSREVLARRQLQEQYSFLDDEDIHVEETEDGKLRYQLADDAGRAVALKQGASVLAGDQNVNISKTDSGDYDVDVAGAGDSQTAQKIEQRIERKLNTGEAFGGETKVSAFGHTLNIDQASEDLSGFLQTGVDAGVSVLDASDIANPGRATGQTARGQVVEDYTLTGVRSAGSALAEIPAESVEAAEAAPGVIDISATAAGEGIGSLGAAARDPIGSARGGIETTRDAGEFTATTAGNIHAAAENNPEQAADVTANLMGGIGAGVALYAATPAGVAAVAKRAPRVGKALNIAIDPAEYAVRRGARATTSAASRATSAATGAGRRASRTVKQGTPDVSVVRDPDAGLVDVQDGISNYYRSRASDATDRAADTVENVASRDFSPGERARDTAGSVRDRAENAAESVTDAPDRVRESAGDLADTARTAPGDIASRGRQTVDTAREYATMPFDEFASTARRARDRGLPSRKGIRRRLEFDTVLYARRGSRGVQRAYEGLATSASIPSAGGLGSGFPTGLGTRATAAAGGLAQAGRRNLTAARFDIAEGVDDVERSIRGRVGAARDLGSAARDGDLTLRIQRPDGETPPPSPDDQGISARGVDYQRYFDFDEGTTDTDTTLGETTADADTATDDVDASLPSESDATLRGQETGTGTDPIRDVGRVDARTDAESQLLHRTRDSGDTPTSTRGGDRLSERVGVGNLPDAEFDVGNEDVARDLDVGDGRDLVRRADGRELDEVKLSQFGMSDPAFDVDVEDGTRIDDQTALRIQQREQTREATTMAPEPAPDPGVATMPNFDDDNGDRRDRDPSMSVGGIGDASDGLFASGWLSETVTTIATEGRTPTGSVSQDRLERQPVGQQLTGELPTYAMLEGDAETQERIADVQSLFGGLGAEEDDDWGWV